MIDIQADADATFEGLSRDSTQAIKRWMLNELNSRMELVGTAKNYLYSLDERERQLEAVTAGQIQRVTDVVTDLDKTKDDVKKLFEEIQVKLSTVDEQLQSVPELTQKLNDKSTEIDSLFKKTSEKLIEKTEQIQANDRYQGE